MHGRCQESWHQKVMKLCAGDLRGSTEVVLLKTLPKILQQDSLEMPEKLTFAPWHTPVWMVRKALKYVQQGEKMIRRNPHRALNETIFHVLRFKGVYERLTNNNMADYLKALCGEAPTHVRHNTYN